MKKTLMALLCLLIGCKELEKSAQEDPPQYPCRENAAVLALTKTNIMALDPSKHYEIKIENKVLWNSCTRTSEYHIYAINLSPMENPSPVTIQSDLLYSLKGMNHVAVEIAELDNQCNATSILYEGYAQQTISTYKDSCSADEYTSGSNIYVNIPTPTQ